MVSKFDENLTNVCVYFLYIPLIFSVSTSGEFSVLAGSGERGNQDGKALAASFCFPNDIAISDDGGTLVVNEVADCTSNGRQLAPTRIRRIQL